MGKSRHNGLKFSVTFIRTTEPHRNFGSIPAPTKWYRVELQKSWCNLDNIINKSILTPKAKTNIAGLHYYKPLSIYVFRAWYVIVLSVQDEIT